MDRLKELKKSQDELLNMMTLLYLKDNMPFIKITDNNEILINNKFIEAESIIGINHKWNNKKSKELFEKASELFKQIRIKINKYYDKTNPPQKF